MNYIKQVAQMLGVEIGERWKPKKGEHYWEFSVSLFNPHAEENVWTEHSVDFVNWKTGNCFKTKEEAETKGKEIMEQIKKEYEENE